MGAFANADSMSVPGPTRVLTLLSCLATVTLCLHAQQPGADHRPRRVTPTHDTDFAPSAELVTPHVAFAKPLADTLRVKALFAVWAPSARQVIELRQRLDFEFDFVGAGGNNLLWRGSSQNALINRQAGVEEVARLAELLDGAHDVIVLGAVPWTWYPDSIQARILARVEAGAGLVITSHRGQRLTPDTGTLAELEKQAQPSAGPHPCKDTRSVSHGAGRIAFMTIPFPQHFDDHTGGFAGTEEWRLEAFARTMLWTAGRHPGLTAEPVIEVAPNSLHVTGGKGVGIAVYRDLERAYPALYAPLPYALRPYSALEPVTPRAVVEHGDTIRVDFMMTSGPYLALVQEKNNAGEVTGWRHIEVTVPGESRITGVDAHTAHGPLRLDNADAPVWVDPQAPVRLAMHTEGVPANAQARLELRDRAGRVVAAAGGSLQADGTFTAELDVSRALHDLLVVQATVQAQAGGPALAEAREPLLVNTTHPWRSPHRLRTFGAALLRPELTGNQISYFPGYNLKNRDSVIMHAWHDIRVNAFSTHGLFPKGDTNERFERTPSFHDPAFRERQREQVRLAFAGTEHPDDPGRIVIANDEWAWGYVNAPGNSRTPDWPASANQDRSPAALEAFRAFLQAQYGDLQRLNRAWGTTYAAWSEVEPYLFEGTPDQAPPEAAWPRIVDHTAFINQTITDYVADIATAARAINPRNRLSVSAFYTLGMFGGVDHYQWAKHAPHVVVYYDWAIWQSFAAETVGRWFGYGGTLSDPMNERFRAWKHLIRGIEGASWSREATFFRPDHTPNPAVAAYYEELRQASDAGLADLLRAGSSTNEIAVLCHPRSFVVHALKDWRARGEQWWKTVFRRKKYVDYLGRYVEEGLLPWECRFVDIEQVERDEYGRFAKPRVLILPLTEALSEREAATLRRFVEQGGVLVGDLNTGSRHEAGGRREDGRGALDELFGITRRQHIDAVATTTVLWDGPVEIPINFRSHDETQHGIDDAWPMNHAYDGRTEVRFADGQTTRTPVLGGTLELAGAQAQAQLPDGAPAFLVNEVGRGKAIYLNYIPWDQATYDRIRTVADIPRVHHTLETGDESIVEAVREYEFDGQLHLAVLTRIRGFGQRWNSKPAQNEYRASLADKRNTIGLDAPRHVYDARRGTYLGLTDRIEVRFSPEWVANVYACLPYRVASVAVTARRAANRGGDMIDYELTVAAEQAAAGTHVLSIAVFGPDGREVPEHAERSVTQHGRASGRVRLAENAPAGPWTIRVRDAATGITAKTTVE